MPVTVSIAGRSFELEVDQSINIGTLKQKIQEKEAIPPQCQKLSIDGVRLKDSKKLSDYNPNKTILLERKTKSFCVNYIVKGLFINFDKLPCEEKIESIKREIQEKFDLPVAEQGLAYNGVRLSDEKTLHECKIRNGAMLFLVPIKTQTVFIRHANKSLNFDFETMAVIRECKAKIRASGRFGPMPGEIKLIFGGKTLDDNQTLNELDFSKDTTVHLIHTDHKPDLLEISIQTPEETVKFQVKASDPVGSLRSLIDKQMKIPDEYEFVNHNEETLDEQKLFSESHIKSGDIIKIKSKAASLVTVYIKGEHQSLNITVDSSKPVRAIKEEIQKQTNVPVENQILYYAGDTLVDSIQIMDYSIGDESTVSLVVSQPENNEKPEYIEIFVKPTTGKSKRIKVDANGTVEALKKNVKENFETFTMEHVLETEKKEKLADNKKYLSEYNIKGGAILKIQEPKVAKLSICVKTLARQQLNLDVDPNMRIEELKKMIEEKTSFPVGEQKLCINGVWLDDPKKINEYEINDHSLLSLVTKNEIDAQVKLPSGEICSQKIEMNEAVASLKNLIFSMKKIEVRDQLILYAGKILDDTATFESYGYKEGDLLICRHKQNSMKEIEVEFADTKEIVKVNYESNDLVEVLKTQIYQMKKIHPKHQVLTYHGAPVTDGKKLFDYRIDPSNKLVLVIPQTTVYLRLPNGKTAEITFPANETINQVKQRTAHRFNIRAENQILYYKGQELFDGRKYLIEYGIESKETIEIMIKKYEFEITFQAVDRKEVKGTFIHSNLVIDLKMFIERELEIPIDEQTLYHNSQLEDSKMLMEYRVGDGSKVTVEAKAKNSLVLKSLSGDEGQNITLEYEETTTVKQIKHMIREDHNIPVDDQVLVYYGEVLENDQTMNNCGIQGRKEAYLIKLTNRRLYLSNIGDQWRILEVPAGNVSTSELESKFAKNLGVPIKGIAPNAAKFKEILSKVRKAKEGANFIHTILSFDKENGLFDSMY